MAEKDVQLQNKDYLIVVKRMGIVPDNYQINLTMNRKIYKQPHMYVRVINPEELLQVVIDSKQPSVPPEEADSKFNHFDDDDDYGFSSDDIWED